MKQTWLLFIAGMLLFPLILYFYFSPYQNCLDDPPPWWATIGPGEFNISEFCEENTDW
ncbi:MAG: hypothetical protein ACJ0RU_03245 [Candidatus Rariloculaceae bacterium]|tara:strand:+ start:1433 stop:1606 length:174 start_codon:yes stop_codon:yes gene_type:complete